MMKLYGHPLSTCTRKVLTVLAEKNHKADFVLVDILKGENKGEAHLARQPFGQVPALDDDGFMLYESRAICRYLDGKLPGTSLLPSDPKQRALAEQWISVETSNFTPHAMKIIMEAFFGPMAGKEPDQAKIEEARKQVERTLNVMEKQLTATPYLAGSQFSIADICFMPYIEYLFAGKQGDMIDGRPHCSKWWKAISDRRSWQIATGKAQA